MIELNGIIKQYADTKISIENTNFQKEKSYLILGIKEVENQQC